MALRKNKGHTARKHDSEMILITQVLIYILNATWLAIPYTQDVPLNEDLVEG